MSRTKLRAALGAAILSTSALTSAPAWADLPVTDPISDGILNAMQSAVTSAISNMEKSLQQAMTDITNPTSLASILTNGFNQNANYTKAQVGAQQGIADASNEANAQFQLQMRDAQIRDQQTLSPQQCVGADDGQVIVTAGGQGWKAAQSIEAVTDARGEALYGTPAYLGAGQASEANAQLHLARYCDTTDVQAGLCSAAATMADADQHADSLFGNDNLNDANGVNAANDFGSELIQPIVPAAIRGDQLTSINGQDAMVRRRSYNARMSLARSVINYAIGIQTPSVTMTPQMQQEMTAMGITVPQAGSWLQSISLEVNRRISDAGYLAGLQSMPPASVEREIASELAQGNYLAFENFRLGLLRATIEATQLSTTVEKSNPPTTEMPSPSIAAN